VEVFAVYRALQTTLQQINQRSNQRSNQCFNEPKELYLFIDSQAAMQRLQAKGNYIVQRAKQSAYKLVRKNTTIFITWCPSHKGIEGNERADRLVKAGLRRKPDREAYISLGYLRSYTIQLAIRAWKSMWDTEEIGKRRELGKQYRLILRNNLTFTLKPKQLTLTTLK
jgi:RNase H